MFINKSNFLAWILLFGAIFAEVIGTSYLKADYGFIVKYASVTIFIAISYFLMGLAIKKIQVGIAYAIWELFGNISIIFISLFYFKEELSLNQFLGIILAIIGIILINLGELRE